VIPRTVTEGDDPAFVVVRVGLSLPKSSTVTVDFYTGRLSDTATAYVDYVGTSGTVTFPPGSTRASIFVPILGDQLTEPKEFFTVTLFHPRGGPVLRYFHHRVHVTIVDDDG